MTIQFTYTRPTAPSSQYTDTDAAHKLNDGVLLGNTSVLVGWSNPAATAVLVSVLPGAPAYIGKVALYLEGGGAGGIAAPSAVYLDLTFEDGSTTTVQRTLADGVLVGSGAWSSSNTIRRHDVASTNLGQKVAKVDLRVERSGQWVMVTELELLPPDHNVSGTAVLSDGSAAERIVAVGDDGVTTSSAVPAQDGSYSLFLGDGGWLVVAEGPAGYRPLAHKVVVG